MPFNLSIIEKILHKDDKVKHKRKSRNLKFKSSEKEKIKEIPIVKKIVKPKQEKDMNASLYTINFLYIIYS